MAKAVAVNGEDQSSTKLAKGPNPVGATVTRFSGFLQDVRGELRKVITPSRKEVQATTAVVIVTVFIFAAYFWAVDNVIGRGITYALRQLGGAQ